MMDTLLQPADVARACGVVPATVRYWALNGILPVAAVTRSGLRLFRAEDVEAVRQAREARGRR